jgi:hypothetical protein
MDRLPSVGAMPGESQKPIINCNPVCMRFMNAVDHEFRLTRIETMSQHALDVRTSDSEYSTYGSSISL